jgi:beta-barrel assembly-enhancing protease
VLSKKTFFDSFTFLGIGFVNYYIFEVVKLIPMKYLTIILAIFLGSAFVGCADGGLNLFSLEDDKQLGLQSKAEIEANPQEFPIIPVSQNPKAYAYIEAMKNEILNSGAVKYKSEFPWEMYIVKRDDVLNAFCTPGGYIYIYTGLIKYLDSASSLAGVMGHEMAHADRRHSTDQLTELYGLEVVLGVVGATAGGGAAQISQIVASLATLKFSRGRETEADEYSVKYLCPTSYHENGAANFFKKMIEDPNNQAQPPVFMSTHPSHESRVEDINKNAAAANCNKENKAGTSKNVDSYVAFKNSL